METANRRAITKQAKERANACSETWVPCITQNNISKPSIKKLLSNDEANELFNEAKSTILCFENITKKIKRLFYQLKLGDTFIGLGYKSEKVVFKELGVSLRHRRTLNRYRNAAKIEVELGLLHDQIPTAVLLELMVGTNAEHRKEIWKLVNIDCLYLGCSDDGKFLLPTVKQVNRIKKNYLYNTPQAIAKRAYLDDIYDDEINPSDSNVKIPVDEWAEKYSYSQLKEFEKDYKAAFEVEDDKYDFTDEQVKNFNEERAAFVVDKYDLTDKERKALNKECEAAFSGCKLITRESINTGKCYVPYVSVDIKKKSHRKRIPKSIPP